jgi:RNA polymerase sigma factor (sigma-70 family)
MNATEILQILEHERAWLAEQPGMQPWDEGCRRVVTLLKQLFQDYSKRVREPATDSPDADVALYLARLWQCLCHHWCDAIGPLGRTATSICTPSPNGRITADQVAQQIAAGQGYRGGGRLGGDPLRDIVLAVAMVAKDGRATQVFQDDYYAFAVAVAAKVHHRLAYDPDPWWSELLDDLAGYTRPKAKLDKFKGRCALHNWLPRVIVRFVHRWRFAGNAGPEPDEVPAPQPPPSESLVIFAEIVRDAVGDLPADDRLLLALIHVDGLQNKQAAAVLGVHEGTASRRHEKSLSRYQAAIAARAQQRLSEDAYTGVLEDLQANPKLFGLILHEALERGTGHQSDTPEIEGAIPS